MRLFGWICKTTNTHPETNNYMASHFVCEKFLFGLYCKLSDLFQLMYGLVYSCLPTTTPLDDLREAFMEKWLLNFAQLKIALKFDTMIQIKNRFFDEECTSWCSIFDDLISERDIFCIGITYSA